MFQAEKDKKMYLNFYTHNLQNINLTATLSRTDEHNNKDETATLQIDKQTSVINIGFIAQNLCKEQITDC